MATLQTLTAVDPLTGAQFTRKTARAYVAAVIVTSPNGLPTLADAGLCQQWASRPDLAQAALAKALKSEPTARLAPVVSPEAEPQAQAAPQAEPTPAPQATPSSTPYGKLVGQAAAGFVRFAKAYRLTAPQAQELARVVWRWAGKPEPYVNGAPYCWVRGAMAAALARRGVLWRPQGWLHTWHPDALAILQELAQAQAEAEAQAQATPAPQPPAWGERVADAALAALAELGATPRTPQEAQAAQGLQALSQARAERVARLSPAPGALLGCEALQAARAAALAQGEPWPRFRAQAEPTPRPTLPGEPLPPAPPTQAGPGPELPRVPTPWRRLTPGQVEAAWHATLTRAVARQQGAQ